MDITLPRIMPTAGTLPDLALAKPQSVSSLSDPRTTSLSLGGPSGTTLGADGQPSSAQGLMQSFQATLAQAMQGINQTHQAADADAARLASGDPVDLHQVMIGFENANLSFGLALQVRNKLLEAYQEVMRMQV